MADQQVKVIIQAEDKSAPAFKSAGDNATNLSKKTGVLNKDVSGLAKTMLGATVAVGGMAVALGISAVKSAIDAENSLAQLNAVLDSTHNAAGLYTQDLLDQAQALQQYTTYNDEAIVGAQSLLLTFTNIKGPVFQESIETILDMSTALGQDLKSSAIQVGKALNDPINGITALSRVGVAFTEQQKAQIETLVKHGQTMQAQRIILSELSTEFGGSAFAAAETFEGKILQLNNTMDDMKEIIGGALIEAIMPFITQLSAWAANPDVQDKVKQIAVQVAEFAAVALPVAIETLRIWYHIWQDTVDAIGTVIFRVQQAIDMFEKLNQKTKGAISGAISTVGNIFSGGLTGFVGNAIGGLTGARASGGPVTGGGTYLVGENGPEIFKPASNGSIIPNMAGAGAGVNITINVSNNTLLDDTAGEKVAEQIMRSLRGNLRI